MRASRLSIACDEPRLSPSRNIERPELGGAPRVGGALFGCVELLGDTPRMGGFSSFEDGRAFETGSLLALASAAPPPGC